jgi:cell shape-determining protein MreC
METLTTENWRERSTRSMVFIVFLTVILLVGLQVGGFDSLVRESMYQVMKPGLNSMQGFRQLEKRGKAAWLLVTKGSYRLGQAESLLSACLLRDDQSVLLQQENRLLREALGRKENRTNQVVRLFGSDTHWFIDAGSSETVNVGDVVLWQGSLVGRVTETNQRYSRVQTLLDREWKIPVEVGTQSAKALFQHTHGYPEVVLLPREAAIQVNDVITTAGNEELRAGIPIGRVKQFEKENQGVTWRADLELYFNYQQDSWVEVQKERE